MTTPAKELKPMKTYKDRMFRMIFSEKEKLYEYQSTYNPNMLLRLLHYISDLYESMVSPTKLYGSSPVQIPPPKFIVFYNGTEKRPEREELCLSRLYSVEEKEICLELKVVMLNINMGHNRDLIEASRTLWEYAEYVRRIRCYRKKMGIEVAVERAITECIAEGILKEFLIKNRAEAKAMSIYEYNEEEHLRMEREDAFEDGLKSGIEQEKINTDREKERADKAIKKVKDMEAELRRLRKIIEKYEK